MTKERIWFIFTSLLVLVIVVALVLQISKKIGEEDQILSDQFAVSEVKSGHEDEQDTQVIQNVTTNDDCYVSGCNNQVCTDTKDYVTDCRWHESYGCYEEGVCERQTDGECGWSRTAEIMQCLVAHIPELAYQLD